MIRTVAGRRARHRLAWRAIQSRVWLSEARRTGRVSYILMRGGPEVVAGVVGRRRVWRNSRRDGAGRTRCTHHAWSTHLSFGSSPRTPIWARSSIAASEAGQMAASDYVLIFFKNCLHLAGRQQMSNTRDGASIMI